MKKIFTMNLPDGKSAVVKSICDVLGAEYAVLDSGCASLRVADIMEDMSGDGEKNVVCPEKKNSVGDTVTKFNMEMAIFAGITNRELDIFLDRYRKSGTAPIALKSVVTETNREWTVEKLYFELAREYLFYKMHGK